MDFKKVRKELKNQGRTKNWLMNQLNSYPMQFHRIEKGYKETPVGWDVKISNLLCVSIDKLK
jgi:hypothetical protein